MSLEERKLNAFEEFFASCNIRFALLVALPATLPSSSSSSSGAGAAAAETTTPFPGSDGDDGDVGDGGDQRSKLIDGTIRAIQSSRLGRLQLVRKRTAVRDGGGDGETAAATTTDVDGDDGSVCGWHLSAIHPPDEGALHAALVARPDVRLPSCGFTHAAFNYGEYLDGLVHGDDAPLGPGGPTTTTATPAAEGPLRVEVLRFVAVDDDHHHVGQTDATVDVTASSSRVEITPSTTASSSANPSSPTPAPAAASAPAAAALGLHLNGNHAMCDGRSLLHFAALALRLQRPSPRWTAATMAAAKELTDEGGGGDNSSGNNTTGDPSSSPWSRIAVVPDDWKDMVRESRTEDWNDVPPYLGVETTSDGADDGETAEEGTTGILTMQELSSMAGAAAATNSTTAAPPGKESEESPRDGVGGATAAASSSARRRRNGNLRFVTPPDVMRKTMALLRQKHHVGTEQERRQRNISLTGLLVALIMESIAKEYCTTHDPERREPKAPVPSREVGVSVMVDLRPSLKNRDVQELPQAIGSVTLLMTEDILETEPPRDDDSSCPLTPLLFLAERLTSQLQRRIRRGEAHRSALALTAGNFGGSSPPATVELSNLGVCPVPTPGTELFTAQRFDGYDGVSCMVHSETYPLPKEEGVIDRTCTVMRWCVSIGDGLDEGLVERIFSRVVAQLEAISDTAHGEDTLNELTPPEGSNNYVRPSPYSFFLFLPFIFLLQSHEGSDQQQTLLEMHY
jgi:hypothetical protein